MRTHGCSVRVAKPTIDESQIFYNRIFYFGLFLGAMQAVAFGRLCMAMEKTIYTREYSVMLSVLRETRERAGLTQVDVAAKLNVTQVFISKCEGGQRRLDLIELRAWCNAMGVSTSKFLDAVELAITGASERNEKSS